MNRTFRVNPEIAYREIEGQVLLLTPDDDVLYTLNRSGQFLWSLLVAGEPESVLVARLTERYDQPEDHCVRDVAGFLDQLEAQAILIRT